MRAITLLFVLLAPTWGFASVQVGTGFSSVTSGRMIPGLELGFGTDSWRATFSSIGVSNSYYFHSSYTASYFRSWKSGPMFWGEVESGLGGGAMYAVRGFQDQGSTEEQKKSDVALGPAFFVQWQLAGPAYLKMDMIWGLRGLTNIIGLNGQDVIFFSVGLRAW
jgi:hypothetical protein